MNRRTPTWAAFTAVAISAATVVNGLTHRGPDLEVLDPFITSAAAVEQIQSHSATAYCLLRAGIWEPDRPDAARFDRQLLGEHPVGETTGGTADTRWLDIRAWDRLRVLIADRLTLCRAKSFDGVAFAAVDGYTQPTGFATTLADQVIFNRALVEEAHRHQLTAAIMLGPGAPDELYAGADLRLAPR